MKGAGSIKRHLCAVFGHRWGDTFVGDHVRYRQCDRCWRHQWSIMMGPWKWL
jgi:hypothetical protein